MNKNIFLTIEIEATKSLPLLNKDGEVIFFYKTEKKEDGFSIVEINRILKKCNDSSQYVEDETRKKVNPNNYGNNYIVSTILGEEAICEVENYANLYDKFKTIAFKEDVSADEIKVMKELIKSFETIVPDSALREIYHLYGKDMFKFISQYI